MKKLPEIFLIAFFILLNICSFSQIFENVKFYDYSTVLNDLSQNGKKSRYYENLDYESMLFLDKNSYQVLIKVNPEFLNERNIDTTNIFFIVPEKYVNEYPVNLSAIEPLFLNNEVWKNTILQSPEDKSGIKLDNEIYTKDNRTAIITLYRSDRSITYRAILMNKTLRLEELYEILE